MLLSLCMSEDWTPSLEKTRDSLPVLQVCLSCSVAIEVPEIILNVDFVFLLLSTAYGHAARMSTPGPMMSGFKIPGLAKLEPLEEK